MTPTTVITSRTPTQQTMPALYIPFRPQHGRYNYHETSNAAGLGTHLDVDDGTDDLQHTAVLDGGLGRLRGEPAALCTNHQKFPSRTVRDRPLWYAHMCGI